MKTIKVLFLLFIAFGAYSQSTKKKPLIHGMYVQWGYNTERYTSSTIRFKMSNGNDFKIYNANAHDQTDFSAIVESPKDITIPQYNIRFGFYLNQEKTRIFEINFDHSKYIVNDFQTVRVKGVIDGKQVDADSVLNPKSFLHFEHTDGANWLHINYAEQHGSLKNRNHTRNILTYLWKAGAGINIPRTDFTWRGDRLNNNFHVAGYNVSAEGSLRFYPVKNFFIEGSAKTGYVRYVNALVDTQTTSGNRATHAFGYFELIGTIGYDIKF